MPISTATQSAEVAIDVNLRLTWQNLRDTFWFLPALLVASGAGLAFALVAADGLVAKDVLDLWPRLFGVGADGARGMLGTIASSMITVAGVVFSITIVALSLASNQYTPRVLRSFMGDRINQSVLGIFVGVFVYCLVVLRTIRGGDEGAFVPSLAVLGALLLALVGVSTLIYFIHHISVSIQAAHILANVADQTMDAVDRFFPEGAREDVAAIEADDSRHWHSVAAVRTGYLQSVDMDGLVRFASERRTVVRMDRAVGHFVIEGTPLVSLLGHVADDAGSTRLCAMLAVGRQRILTHDPAFGIRLIVDVALKATSPGVNDTTTAVMAVDYLTAILLRIGQRAIPSAYRGETGEVRVLTCGPRYAGYVDDAFDQIRCSGMRNFVVLDCLLASIGTLAQGLSVATRRAVLRQHVDALAHACEHGLETPRERKRASERLAEVRTLVEPRCGDDAAAGRPHG